MDAEYFKYSVSTKTILQELVLYLKHTFGSIVEYVGTTTPGLPSLGRIHDIDIMVVFSRLSESQIVYVWKIISRLHSKYSISLDTRIYSKKDLQNLPIINQYLLHIFLSDELGTNPFKDLDISLATVKKECKLKIREQISKIINSIPRVASETAQLRSIAQFVYDGIRMFLILEDHPIASKEEACAYFTKTYPDFSEAAAIYEGYLNPETIVDLTSYILDSLALAKHLSYKADNKSLSDEILLVNTPSSTLSHPKDDYLGNDHNMPLGLVCVASYVKQTGLPVTILDAYAENLDALSTVDRIFSMQTIPKIIGFNTSSPNIHVVLKIAKYLKRIRKDLVLVCGGPHASLAPEHTLSDGVIDYSIIGEGEISFSKLVSNLMQNEKGINIPGVFYMVSNKMLGKENQEELDLSKLPTPDFGLLPLDRYFGIKKRIYLHTSRGCAFNCIYCSVPKCWGRKVREIPIEILIGQLRASLDKYKPDEIQIVDDNFSHRKGALIKNFCEQIIANNLTFKWKCQVRTDQLDENVIKMMASSGCFEVDMGIESGNEKIQRYIRKNLDLQKTLQVIALIHQENMFTKAFFMVGFPEESFDAIADTVNYSIKLKDKGLDDVAFFPVMPFPGTDISQITGMVVFQGAVIDSVDSYEHSFAAHRLRKYSAKPEISLNRNFTPEKLRLLVKFAYQRFELGAFVENLKDEFNSYVETEESYLHGI
jgi:radical SAM superfamily enzyme YgiQ (UPF0313 family)